MTLSHPFKKDKQTTDEVDDAEAFEAWKKLERYRARLVSAPSARSLERRIVGVKDWQELGFATEGSFGAWMRSQAFSFRAGHKRVAYLDDVLTALESRRKVVAPPESGESIDTIYARLAGGSK